MIWCRAAKAGSKACFALALGVTLTFAGAAAAQELDANGAPVPSIATSLPHNGDPGGIRKWLYERGLTYSFILTSEILGNVSGGLRQSGVFQGKFEGRATADLEKMFGLRGLTFFVNAAQLHGSGGVRRDLTGSFNTISNIEALPTVRLSEIWLEQKFGELFSVRAGQLTSDSEFIVSDVSSFFMNSDWPTITALNLPNGGPAFPLSTPGVRLKFTPHQQLTFLAALFNGDPAGPGLLDSQIKNRHGVNFRVQDPPLLMGEGQFRYNQGKDDKGLAGTLKLGFWHHFGDFDSQRFDNIGLSLASPASTGIPARFRTTSGVYGVIDQQIWRPAGGGPDSGVSIYARAAASAPDRNPVQFFLDGGIVFAGPLPGRDDDKFGVNFIYTQMSRDLAALDRDTTFFTGLPQPVRDHELSFSVSYQARLVPGWTMQPEFHYIMHPGGHVPDPNSAVPGAALRDAKVFAIRSVITY